MALALASEGIRLALTARSEEELNDLAAEIADRGGQADVFPADLADLESIPSLAARVQAVLGSIDLLVNNAGVFMEKSVAELSLEDWDRTLRVNLSAPFVLCRELLPNLAEAGTGRIINIASTASHQGYLNQAAYCASKHGLLGFARALAIEAKPRGIHVHTLCPGGVETDLIKGTYLSSRLQGQPMIQPEDIAAQVIFLLRQSDNVDIPEIITRRFIP